MSVTSLRPVALPNVASPSLRFSFVTPLSAISLGGVRARVCCARMNANMCVCVPVTLSVCRTTTTTNMDDVRNE